MLTKPHPFILLDGAMGTMLQASDAPMGKVPEELNCTHPQVINAITRAYVEAGADIVYSNTFSANRYKLAHADYDVEVLIATGVKNAKECVSGTSCKVGLSIGPIGELLAPNGSLKFEDAYDMFREMVVYGAQAGADLVAFETFTDLLELKAAVLAAREHTTLPVYTTMTFEPNGRTFTGVTIASMAITLTALGVDALGFNCSLGPREILPFAKELIQWTDLPIIVKANAGLPNLNAGGYDITADEFVETMEEYLELGVSIVGGCCGTTPGYIAKLRGLLDRKQPTAREYTRRPTLCSGTQAMVLDGVRIVGERINPTGKKLFKEALLNRNFGYILTQGLEQVQAGAAVLDVNVGLPGIDERAMMLEVIEQLQSVLDTPLQIDSSDADVIEAALRAYNGKPIVNSVNGEQAVLERILPLVKKYGAAVIGLTMDENGIPLTAEARLAIAERIVAAAEALGIPREDIVIDCLTLTASAQQKEVVETLKAMTLVKERLGVKTTLGVSNISFGLPNRELINTSFLTMAMAHGLDLPIINPNIEAMTAAIDAFNVLTYRDVDSTDYISKHSNQTAPTTAPIKSEQSLSYAVLNGLKDIARSQTKVLLQNTNPMEIVNGMLIPALDQVGTDFESGKLFLPQLIQSATAAQAGFDEIKAQLARQNDGGSVSKGKIVVATVKGDVHDIGKNIVKVILENYGYDVLDLGKDVAAETIVEETKRSGAKLVGLSALMTTTVVHMEATIQALKATLPDVKIWVGGAVLTEEYALQIGADFYAKDAKQSVDIAKQILG